jgi:hypothetical protein
VIGYSQAAKTENAGSSGKQSETETENVDYLFVLSAKGSSLADGVLRLIDVAPSTIYFSDRPERITGQLTTQYFIEHWNSGDNSFQANPPNATLSILSGDLPQEIVLVLKSPRMENKDLLYDVEILEGSSEAVGLASSVFIDIIVRPLTPVSVAGVARRSIRRERLR